MSKRALTLASTSDLRIFRTFKGNARFSFTVMCGNRAYVLKYHADIAPMWATLFIGLSFK